MDRFQQKYPTPLTRSQLAMPLRTIEAQGHASIKCRCYLISAPFPWNGIATLFYNKQKILVSEETKNSAFSAIEKTQCYLNGDRIKLWTMAYYVTYNKVDKGVGRGLANVWLTLIAKAPLFIRTLMNCNKKQSIPIWDLIVYDYPKIVMKSAN